MLNLSKGAWLSETSIQRISCEMTVYIFPYIADCETVEISSVLAPEDQLTLEHFNSLKYFMQKSK